MTNALETKVASYSNSQLVKIASGLQDILSAEADAVMSAVLMELSRRYDEAEFVAICADLDGKLAYQAAAADPMHY
jgi:hypothetical protein